VKGGGILKTFIQKDKRPRKSIPNKEYYRSLLDVKQEAAVLLDFDGDILMVNAGFEKLTGYIEQDVVDLPSGYLFLKNEGDDNPFLQKNLREFDAVFILLASEPCLITVHINCREIEGQKYLGIINRKLVRDQKREEMHTEAAEYPAVARHPISEGEKTVHHIPVQNDIRTALNGIIGYGSLLLKEDAVAMNQQSLEYARGIMHNSKRIKVLLDRAGVDSDFSGGQKNVSSFSLEMLVRQIEAGFSKQLRERTIQCLYQSLEPYVLTTDEECLHRVLHFLMEKAVLYTRSNAIKIDASHNVEKETFEITIDNIGLDIPQSIVQHIQRENSKSHYQPAHPALNGHDRVKGFLLDLNLLEARVFFDTASGLSQLASIVFPESVLESVDEIEKRLASELQKKQLKVLVVEDDEVSAHILMLFLKDIADVELAYSGNEALNLVEHYYGKGVVFDMFVMDINLPAPWDGFLLKKEIIGKWPDYSDTPFLAQTANTEEECVSQLVAEKFSACLYKPVIKVELLRLINKYSRK
jgi:CheY-like chemotaxis protein/signal transduction histidine kinase